MYCIVYSASINSPSSEPNRAHSQHAREPPRTPRAHQHVHEAAGTNPTIPPQEVRATRTPPRRDHQETVQRPSGSHQKTTTKRSGDHQTTHETTTNQLETTTKPYALGIKHTKNTGFPPCILAKLRTPAKQLAPVDRWIQRHARMLPSSFSVLSFTMTRIFRRTRKLQECVNHWT